jgi:uncharacterized protein with GYD domain
MGQYDGIVIVEAPRDETIMSIVLGDASKGNFRSSGNSGGIILY